MAADHASKASCFVFVPCTCSVTHHFGVYKRSFSGSQPWARPCTTSRRWVRRCSWSLTGFQGALAAPLCDLPTMKSCEVCLSKSRSWAGIGATADSTAHQPFAAVIEYEVGSARPQYYYCWLVASALSIASASLIPSTIVECPMCSNEHPSSLTR